MDHIVALLGGLANGGLYAALALTLVLTYRSSGVLNFSSGAMACLGAYIYSSLRYGYLLIPFPTFDKNDKAIDLGYDVAFVPAALLTLIICGAVGLLIYLGVFRPLRAATPVAKAVASVGVMVVLNGLFQLRFPSTPAVTDPVLGDLLDTWDIGGGHVPLANIWLALTIVGITFALASVYRFTRFGLLTRAAAESERGAYVSGIRPDRVAAANWVISGVVSGIAGILIAPLQTLAPYQYTLLIVPALASAVLGQFQFMVPAVAGGLFLGMLQSETDLLQTKWDWLPAGGEARYQVVALLLILIVLVLRAKPLPSRGLLLRGALGRAPRPRRVLAPALIGSAVGVVALVTLEGDWRIALISSLLLAIVSLSLVVVTGYAGQVSLAQLSIAGVAGFTLSTLTHHSFSIPFPIAPLVAAAAAAVFGVVVGLPALRIRGLPVAVVTLAAGVALQAVWFANSEVVSSGGKVVEGPKLLGLDLRALVGTDFPRWQFGVLVLFVLILVAVGVARLRLSRLGSQMLAVRANERSAAGAGIDVVRTKIIAFALGSFIAGLAGALYGYFQASGLTADPFDALIGLAVFTGAYLAGITSVSGGLLAGILAAGGIFAHAMDTWTGLDPQWYAVVSGIGLVVIIITNPEGIVGPFHARIERQRRLAAAAAPEAVPHDSVLTAVAPVTGGEVVLSATAMHVQYGGVVAVDGATIEARRGTIVGLIGPNGAGKTTLLDAISGFAPSSGQVLLGGKSLDDLPPYKRVRAGLGRTFQHSELYEDLTVTENIVVGAAAAAARSARPLAEVLELLDLAAFADRPVSELSQGRRQVVSIARALIGNPEVLLLDEPAGGLDSRESQWLGLRLRALRDSGTTIVIIDHDMHLVLNLCDSIYVLNFGEIIASGTPATIRADRTVAAAYLGAGHAEQEVVSRPEFDPSPRPRPRPHPAGVAPRPTPHGAPSSPVPSSPVPSSPVPSNPVPSNPVPSNPVPSSPVPS